MPDSITVALTQMPCTPDAAGNLRRQLALLGAAADRGAQILCTQELFGSQYFCQVEDHHFFGLAETIPGPSTDALSQLARNRGVVIIGSIFEKRAPGLYHNTAVILETDGSIAGIYRKMHIPDDPLYYEKFYFAPGDTGFRAFDTTFARIGVLICWDQWFPEAARLAALNGAQILFYPSAIGWHPAEKPLYGQAQHESWELIQRSHAIANGCFVCSSNRVGHELIRQPDGSLAHPDGIEFWGQSFIASPTGQVLGRASVTSEEILLATLDLDQVEFSRTHWPFLRDRRIDAYAPLTRRFIDANPGA